ncbi:hypothetical protein VPH35_137359 [Triticum aestivum]
MVDAVDARRVCGMPEKAQLHVVMLALQFGYAGFHVVYLPLNMGIGKLVFPVYRNIITLILLVPFAYFLEKKDRPKLTLNFGFYLLGLDNTSPTFAPAIQNSVLAITFTMAAALRIEKVVGTLACVAGASVITLYKGPTIFGPVPFLAAVAGEGKNWTLGCVYLIGHCLSWSGWLVLQAPVLKKYPARLSVTSYTCFFGVIQFLVIAAFFERDVDAWVFHSGSEIFTILYALAADMANENGNAGFIASGVAFAVQICCIDRGGPVFVAVYQPVQTLVVAIMASITLGENEERSRNGKEAAAMAVASAAFSGGEREVRSAKLGSSITQPLLPPSSTTSDNV